VTIIGFTIGMAVWLPQTIMLVSRNMFAWSFDRVVPERLSYVDRRSRSPIVAIGVMLVARRPGGQHGALLSLHGHVHESPGATHIGRTLCINPGSDYHTGRISACLINLRHGTVRHQFVTG
jgi:hypothetical protein